MTSIIMLPDVVKHNCLFDAWPLVECARVVEKVGVIDDSLFRTFEVHSVDGIESNERREEPPISFGYHFAAKISL